VWWWGFWARRGEGATTRPLNLSGERFDPRRYRAFGRTGGREPV